MVVGDLGDLDDLGEVHVHAGHGAASTSAHLVDAGVGGDPVDPCAERAAPVESAEGSQRGDERVLGGIESIGIVAEHSPAQRVHTVVVRGDQDLESVAVARARRVEKVPVDIPGLVAVVVDAGKANPPCPNVDGQLLRVVRRQSDGGHAGAVIRRSRRRSDGGQMAVRRR